MSHLSADLAARIGKLLPLLSSSHSGEVAATAAAIGRTLSAGGQGWLDLAAHVAEAPRTVVVYRDRRDDPGGSETDSRTPQQDRARVARCQTSGVRSPWEDAFLASLAQQLARGRRLSPRQSAILDDICAKTGATA